MSGSIADDMAAAMERVREAGGDDHFYGAWYGGKETSGGHPVHGAEQIAPPKADRANAVQLGYHVYSPDMESMHFQDGTIINAHYSDAGGARTITGWSTEGGTAAARTTAALGYVYGAMTQGPKRSAVAALTIASGALAKMEPPAAQWLQKIGTPGSDGSVSFDGPAIARVTSSIREAGGTDDHYYGAWEGGRASAGGHPAGPAGGYGKLVSQAKDGGFSVKAFGAGSPTNGFMVSAYPDRESTFPVTSFGKGDVKSFIAKNQDLLNKPGHYLGGWLDNGLIYLDVSQNVATEDLARQIGKDAHQLAAWDIKGAREVNLRESSHVTRRALLHPKSADHHIDAFVQYLKGNGPA